MPSLLSWGRLAEARHRYTARPTSAPTAALSMTRRAGRRHAATAAASAPVVAAVSAMWAWEKVSGEVAIGFDPSPGGLVGDGLAWLLAVASAVVAAACGRDRKRRGRRVAEGVEVDVGH